MMCQGRSPENELDLALETLPIDIDRAAAEYARRMAAIVGETIDRVLRNASVQVAKPVALPAKFLPRLAAAIQIQQWQMRSDLAEIGNRFPSFDGLSAELSAWAQAHKESGKDPGDFTDPDLECRVMRTWLEEFSWDAPRLLGADVHLDKLDDHFVELVAEWLWKH